MQTIPGKSGCCSFWLSVPQRHVCLRAWSSTWESGVAWVTFQRWSQVKGSKVNEGISWREIFGPGPPPFFPDTMGQTGLLNIHSYFCHFILPYHGPKEIEPADHQINLRNYEAKEIFLLYKLTVLSICYHNEKPTNTVADWFCVGRYQTVKAVAPNPGLTGLTPSNLQCELQDFCFCLRCWKLAESEQPFSASLPAALSD